ncbi:MAG: SIS domain-containing protein [Candidatus Falkowbacteria bacterium]|nr:SIS domain-containing protein [Candidatus Falkowbacteria bacterium]
MAKINYKMIKEIKEQPQVIKRIINKHLLKDKVIFKELNEHISELKKIKRFIFLGCGTSYHSAFYGNLVFEEIMKLNCEVEFADEFNKRNPVIESNTAIIILSQSGETAEAIRAAKLARSKKVFIISITNNKNSKLAKLADVNIDLEAGQEKAVPATKTFSSELLILVLLALFIQQIKDGKVLKIVSDVKKLPKLIKGIIAKEKNIKNLAMKLASQKEIIILGEKYNYPIALEGALKLKEAANIFAEGMATEEFEHGPKALSDKINLIKINKQSLEINGKKIAVPKISEILLPILLVIPLQLLAFHLAIQKGIDVDKPKNIKKYIS